MENLPEEISVDFKEKEEILKVDDMGYKKIIADES